MPIESLTLPVVIGAATVDSINPCAIGVLLLLLAVLSRHTKDRGHLVKISAIYITVVYIVYMLSGLGLIWFQSFLIGLGLAAILGTVVGLLVIAGGIIEVKDFFAYGKGFSLAIPAKYSRKIKEKATHVTAAGAVFLGAFVAMVELPCTGGPYLAITALLAKQFDITAFFYMIIYNIIFVLPLAIITVLAYYHTNISGMTKWKQNKRKWMRLAAGVLMILLGIFMIYYYQIGHF